MSTRHELTDEQWAVIEPLLPKPKPGPGRPPADPRKTLNGILYVLKTGCIWAGMSRQYGSATTCWRRLKQWSENGTWERIWRALLSRMDAEEKIEWAQAFPDGRVPAKKRGNGIGKTKAGKGTKVMMISDGNGFPPFSEKDANAVVAAPSMWERDTAGVRFIERCFGWMNNY